MWHQQIYEDGLASPRSTSLVSPRPTRHRSRHRRWRLHQHRRQHRRRHRRRRLRWHPRRRLRQHGRQQRRRHRRRCLLQHRRRRLCQHSHQHRRRHRRRRQPKHRRRRLRLHGATETSNTTMGCTTTPGTTETATRRRAARPWIRTSATSCTTTYSKTRSTSAAPRPGASCRHSGSTEDLATSLRPPARRQHQPPLRYLRRLPSRNAVIRYDPDKPESGADALLRSGQKHAGSSTSDFNSDAGYDPIFDSPFRRLRISTSLQWWVLDAARPRNRPRSWDNQRPYTNVLH